MQSHFNPYNKNSIIRTTRTIQQKKSPPPPLTSPRISRNISKPQPYVLSAKQSAIKPSTQKSPSVIKYEEVIEKYTQKKLLCFVLKQIVYELFLKTAFVKIRNHLKVKKFTLQLLLMKRKRHMIEAFQTLKMLALQIKDQKYCAKTLQLRIPNMLCIFLSKLLKKQISTAFNLVKEKSIRKRRVCIFINKLMNFSGNFIKNEHLRTFLTKLQCNTKFQIYRQKYIKKISLLYKKSSKRILSQSFKKILNFSVYNAYEFSLQIRRSKNKEVVSLSTSRKTILTEQKQKVKKLKHMFDSINLEKNRAHTELKKSRTMIKQQLNIDIKSLLKDQEDLKCSLQSRQLVLKQKQKQLYDRLSRKKQAEEVDFTKKIMNIYSKVQSSPKDQIKIKEFEELKEIVQGEQLSNFINQSKQCNFWLNLQLMELILKYEKVKLLSREEMDQVYLQKLQQNQILKQMISTLAHHQIQKGVHGSIITFSKEISIQPSNFSPLKSNRSKQSQEHATQSNTQSHQKQSTESSLLLVSSKGSSRVGQIVKKQQKLVPPPKILQQLPQRTAGKISSRAVYSNTLT